MSKQANQSQDWNFNVQQIQLRHPVTGAPINQWGNFREDTGECLGVASERYGILQNSALMNAAMAALEKRGMTDYQTNIIAAGDGARFYAEFSFKNRQLASAVGDIFGIKLILQNSFDRSLRASFSLGFIRLACLNGAATMTSEFSVTRKHSTQIVVDFVGAAIDNAMRNSQSALGVYDEMAQIGMSDMQGLNVIDNFIAANILSGSMGNAIKPLWLNPLRQEDKARTLYGVYNAITEHLTHRVAGERYEYANKVGSNILLRMVTLARNPGKLALAIKPANVLNVQTVAA